MLLETKSFNLQVNNAKHNCLFKLSWQGDRQLFVTVDYPTKLIEDYDRWQNAYLNYYSQNLRGKVMDEGDIPAPKVDWSAKLNEDEKILVTKFNEWLRCQELYEIREKIKSAIYQPNSHWVDIFFSCDSLKLARLPWEAWEISGGFGASGKIRISRFPSNIREQPARPIRRKARILTIIGDDNALDFQADREAVKSLSRITDVKFIGWQPKKDINELKTEIWQAIANSKGWDILFFAGHSNETILTEGEFSIAPGVFMSIEQIKRPLQQAIKNGLQVAIFNSCKGMSIAESLISLGLTQVVVMREPIHNLVAHEFIVDFTKSLAEYKDIHEALLDTCRAFYTTEKSLIYPSAYLILSLFRRPDSELFKIEPFGFKQWFKRCLPTFKEAAVLALFSVVSWQLSVQLFLLDRRVFLQAIYRQVTGQNLTTQIPPVLLVQIDDESIIKAEITEPNPIKRDYLASLIAKISESEARVVGIDYLLDRPHKKIDAGVSDRLLATALQTSVKKQQWIVFAKDEYGVFPEIASLNWSLQGNMTLLAHGRYLTTIDFSTSEGLTFASMLAFVYQLNYGEYQNFPLPNLESKLDFFRQLSDYLKEEKRVNHEALFSPAARLNFLTVFSYWLGQMWLHPIVDFSISYDQVYDCISAWRILDSDNLLSSEKTRKCEVTKIEDKIKQQVVIIAPGGYDNAGLNYGEDNIENSPMAFRYWSNGRKLTGGEIHAYMVHHFLTNRFVIPIPDLWMILVTAVLGKGVILVWNYYLEKRGWLVVVFVGGNLVYILVSLQVYISGAVLLPVVLPSVMFWAYILVNIQRKNDSQN